MSALHKTVFLWIPIFSVYLFPFPLNANQGGIIGKDEIPIIRDRIQTTNDIPNDKPTHRSNLVIIETNPEDANPEFHCDTLQDAREFAIINNTNLTDFQKNEFQDEQCFSNNEQLTFGALTHSEIIIGPYFTPWYRDIQRINRKNATVYCKLNVKKTYKISKTAFSKCFEREYSSLMEPYEKKLQDEKYSYIQKRKNTSKKLLYKCEVAVKNHHKTFPKDLRLPIKKHSNHFNAFPASVLSKIETNDEMLIKNKGKITTSTILSAILGDSCPGDMVLWITYPEIEILHPIKK